MAFMITFLGKNYTSKEFSELPFDELPNWAQSAHEFIGQWQSGQQEYQQYTSGSTGNPKEVLISRKRMEASAAHTIKALQIPTGAQALHCINSAYIGGKMMWVRAFLGEWHVHLIQPEGLLLAQHLWPHYHFSAMVPLQVDNTISKSRELFDRFDQIIVGGAAVSAQLIEKLKPLTCTFYSTFGMTETVSHIALRKLNGVHRRTTYQLVGDNQIKTNKAGCLMVKGVVTDDKWITTNDLIEKTADGFKWIGRLDLVVNSGGVKIQLEKAEDALNHYLNNAKHQFLYWKEAHDVLGEQLIGLSDSKVFIEYLKEHAEELKRQLPDYHFPKKWYFCEKFERTESDKVDRAATAQKATAAFSF